MKDNYLYLARRRGVSRPRQNGNGSGMVIFGLSDGPEGWQRRTIYTMAFGNPPSGMIADPERHARDSQLATCGTAARSAVADRVLRSRWFFFLLPPPLG
jgi:hypothetical protein